MTQSITKVLVANRGEIAIRVMRTANEMGIRTVAIYAHEDRFALHRFKADESYLVGSGQQPIAAYLDIDAIIQVARDCGADAIHPGYGFLSENPNFPKACEAAGIVFIGPPVAVLNAFGDKVSAREAAERTGVPVIPASGVLPDDRDEIAAIADKLGYPLMIKASWGGGGRGMRRVEDADKLLDEVDIAKREAGSAFGNDAVYLEKLVERARHVEVQILGDSHGNVVHLFERDCSVQRRNQKVVERAPAPYLDDATRQGLCDSAMRLCSHVGYVGAGTVEFLLDVDSGAFYFIEVNPRIQVEHTVTEEVTGVDVVRAQIRIAEGAAIGADDALPAQELITIDGHALQCRVTTEDPENGFAPDHGRLTAYRSSAGFGVRLDGGTAYTGAVITPYYDSLLVKVTTWARTVDATISRMDRALREFRIRGLSTNLQFLENVIGHPSFMAAEYTTRFIDTTPELFEFKARQDRATRLLRFIGDVTVNGHPQMEGRTVPRVVFPEAPRPACDLHAAPPRGLRDELLERGPAAFGQWMREQQRVLLTDTTMRDAHQSLLATRMRTHDIAAIAPYYARMLPGLLSLECWGGATFDVALRFLKEDPWERLALIREAAPNIPLQMLLRASNAVGYTNYPDNVVRYFVAQAARNGIDIFRVFDSLNWVENMRVAMDAVIEAGGVCEGTICYTGDLFDPARPKYNLKYYVDKAKALEKAGAHVLGIKDMAGICRPRAAAELVRVLKQETGLPIHFHTHDTSGIAASTLLAAVEAGVDAIDGALDSMSGLTSQPNLGSMAAALEHTDRDPGIDREAMQSLSNYWEGVRSVYAPFEANVRSGTADVYRHEMPGGQYTNLREQARALGLADRWPEIAKAYAQVNQLFGDIVKVTPTSKVVGDMALHMVANDRSAEEIADPDVDIDFPDSVVALFKGELGFPADGFPESLQKKVLRGEKPLTDRPGALLDDIDLEAERETAGEALGTTLSDTQLASHLMYPKVFADYVAHRQRYGNVSPLSTQVFFYGLRGEEETRVDIEPGKRLLISLQGQADADEDGIVRLFFELNGQPRPIRIARAGSDAAIAHPKADKNDANQVGAPMPGMVVHTAVREGQEVKAGDALLGLEAMKMETTISAPHDGRIATLHVSSGVTVAAGDLLVTLDAP
ncbi:pyruvate carboxylase [Endozoicomonas sp. G2_2]|uniref:pyruvate carboxylase n=1 Tax=Endozoicomonas sp. G2_2 TaxID=2821092 RepID=UPI001AD9CA64|nr:pyruvate carboxylase [Endozoicomonas sp. G2_2]MBO9470734.1 pyruvate carboxylase [Endozoicomonas sp. G2_2]